MFAIFAQRGAKLSGVLLIDYYHFFFFFFFLWEKHVYLLSWSLDNFFFYTALQRRISTNLSTQLHVCNFCSTWCKTFRRIINRLLPFLFLFFFLWEKHVYLLSWSLDNFFFYTALQRRISTHPGDIDFDEFDAQVFNYSKSQTKNHIPKQFVRNNTVDFTSAQSSPEVSKSVSQPVLKKLSLQEDVPIHQLIRSVSEDYHCIARHGSYDGMISNFNFQTFLCRRINSFFLSSILWFYDFCEACV